MGTATLTVLCIAWLVAAVALCLRVIRPRPSTAGRQWIGSGVLVIMSAAAASQFARNRNWPVHSLLGLDRLTMLMGLIGIGCIAAGVVFQVRSNATASEPDGKTEPGQG